MHYGRRLRVAADGCACTYLWRPNLPDEADNHVVELSVAGGAEVIVTHNMRDFERAELRFPGLRVLTPGELITGE